MATLVIDHAATRAASADHVCEHEAAPASASPPPERAPAPQVSVNGVAIPRKAISAEVQNFPARNPGEAWQEATRALVIRELLLQECARLGVEAEQQSDDEGRLETEEDARIRALLEQEARVPHADDGALQRYYDNNRRRFVTAPLFEADHILFAASRQDKDSFAAALGQATEAAAVLARQPERFEALARDCSACPSASVGGNLGQIGPGDTTPEFEAALGALAPGETSGPVETRYGVHLIRLRRRVEGRQLPFEVVRERIADYLAQHVRRQAAAQFIDVLVGRADIRGIALKGAESPLVQ